jgi:hypothetical protein
MSKVGEGLPLVKDETTTLPGLYKDVIDVELQVAPDLSLKIGLHTPLVGGPCIL